MPIRCTHDTACSPPDHRENCYTDYRILDVQDDEQGELIIDAEQPPRTRPVDRALIDIGKIARERRVDIGLHPVHI